MNAINEKILRILESNVSPQLVYFGAIASIILGIVLLLAGVYLKNRENQWWILLVLLGVATVFINVMQII